VIKSQGDRDCIPTDEEDNMVRGRVHCLLHDFSREFFMQRLRYERLKSLATLKKCVHV
jgi:hypothetical protein